MKLGVLGAGQLGRMLALAGYPLGFEFLLFDPAADACAAPLAPTVRAAFDDERGLAEFCAGVDAVTFEFENVPLATAAFVAARVPLRPGTAALATAQDRLNEKRLFASLGIAVPKHAAVDTRGALDEAVAHCGLPAVLKTRRFGYDGKGQIVLRQPADLDPAFQALAGGRDGAADLILEAFVAFEREVSCLGVRGLDGALAFYPLAQNSHRDGILRVSRPRRQDPLQDAAERATARVMQALDYVGVLGFEFFVAEGALVANEIAPRVHNSGHWSIEGAVCSQFENHLRAVAGLPLGATALRGASLMLNLIGALPTADPLLALPGLHLHDYGKLAKPGRKLGHLTLTADDDEALDRLQRLVEPLMTAR